MDPHVEKKIKKTRREKKFKQTFGLELGSPINILPTDILLNILCFLPVESVLQCKLVCKTWRSLLSGTYFSDMHLSRGRQLQQLDDRANVGLGFLFSIQFKSKKKGDVRLYYEKNNVEEQYSFKKLKMINHPPINQHTQYNMLGSCNGLVCLAVTNYGYYSQHSIFDRFYPCFSNDPVYIFNPITREYVNLLPRIKEASLYNGSIRIVSGFGYHSFSNEYKVVRIYYSKLASTTGQVQVYTLGNGSGWRNKGEIKYDLRACHLSVGGTLVNGSLHWLDYKDMQIVAFDLSDEEFRVVTPPPCFLAGRNIWGVNVFHLRELGGYLCAVHQVKGERVDIWSLKMNTKNNTAYNMKEQEYRSTWSMEFSITWVGDKFESYNPFAITKSGEVLLLHNQKTLYCYDPKTAATSEIVVNYNDDKSVEYINAMPHTNSLVSLNSLGERCRRRINKLFLGKDN